MAILIYTFIKPSLPYKKRSKEYCNDIKLEQFSLIHCNPEVFIFNHITIEAFYIEVPGNDSSNL